MQTQLTQSELERYSRQICLEGIGLEGQKRLKAARVLVVGAGGLGSPCLQYLAAAGIGTIGLLDGDKVVLSNLHRQILFTRADIGRNKAEAAKERLLAANPEITVHAYPEMLSTANALSYLKGYDLIIDGSDNFPTRYLINDACLVMGKPFISASILSFSGQLSVFNYKDGPSLRCLFPEPPPAENVPSCDQLGVLGVLPGIMGCLQANECIKLILGKDGLLSGRLLSFDALTMTFKSVSFRADPGIKAKTKLQTAEFYKQYGECKMEDNIREIDASELKEKLESDPEYFYLLDVRTPAEREMGHIGGEFIPLADLPHQATSIKTQKPIVAYCSGGVRSLQACKLLIELAGLTNVYSLKGGLKNW